MIQFTNTGYGRYGFAVLPNNQYNLYLFKLWTDDVRQDPQCVYKIGITSAADPYNRLRYNAIADRVTISQVFPNAVLLAQRTFKTRAEAEAFESYLFTLVPKKDFLIETRISGITEMRRWDQEDVDKLLQEINKSD